MTSSKQSRVILHVDADAFFASCEQAMHPMWKGKPVVCGGERGIAVAVSYEAKKLGVTRGMPIAEVRRTCPGAIIVSSDYEVYSMFSMRMFGIMRRYVGDLEEYSIDEAFADITGIPETLSMNYEQLLKCIQEDIELSLGISVSVGCGSTKTLAKIASSINKPHGLIAAPTLRDAQKNLYDMPIGDVWGIGQQHRRALKRFGIVTVKDLIVRGELFVRRHFDAPMIATYRELKGVIMFPVNTLKKDSFLTIMKSNTFEKTINEQQIWAECVRNLERACSKTRLYGLRAKTCSIFIKTQTFEITSEAIKLPEGSNIPLDFIENLRLNFKKLYKPGVEYRTTGIILGAMELAKPIQPQLFGSTLRKAKLQKAFAAVDAIVEDWGTGAIRSLCATKSINDNETESWAPANSSKTSQENPSLISHLRHLWYRRTDPISSPIK